MKTRKYTSLKNVMIRKLQQDIHWMENDLDNMINCGLMTPDEIQYMKDQIQKKHNILNDIKLDMRR